RNSGGRSYYFRSNESAAEAAARRFLALDRPMTRGELACSLLRAALPGENNDELDAPALRDAAVDFWKNHRAKSRLELATLYLELGSGEQRQQATALLLESDDTPALALFEKTVLASNDPMAF